MKKIDAGPDSIRIQVIDFGLGIDRADLPKLFKPFYKTKNEESLKANPSGNSLGLSISRNIALGLNGDLTVISEIGKGSAFTFTFQAEKSICKRKAGSKAG